MNEKMISFLKVLNEIQTARDSIDEDISSYKQGKTVSDNRVFLTLGIV